MMLFIGIGISLYFHIPFCNRKCPYCHFYVIPNKKEHRAQLLEALFLEWNRLRLKLQEREIVSIYFGGGTPTLFGSSAIDSLLSKIRAEATLSPDCEVTIEANPEDITLELMQGLKAAGINRVSIGVQSLEDDSLVILERTHTAQKAIEGIFLTCEAGIDNISIDLMFELPHQTVKSFEKTLSKLESLPLTHLSLYNLTIEPHTAFFKRTLNLPSPEENFEMLQAATTQLEKIGLHRYEISAFAKRGFSSRHNTGYWTGRPFLGLGPSAFSYFEGKRFRNIASLSHYTKALQENRSPVDFVEKLPYPDDVHELLAIHLRLLDGVDLKKFELSLEMEEKIQRLTQEGYLLKEGSCCKLSSKGLLFYDTVASEII